MMLGKISLRYAFRVFAHSPASTVLIILVLALGIGANTTVFSFMNSLLLKPLPFKDSERLVRIDSLRGTETGGISVLEIKELNDAANLFEGFASFRSTQYNISDGGIPETVFAAMCTYNLFELLGVKPLRGQIWAPQIDGTKSNGVALSYRLWKRRYGSDPTIVGKTITLDSSPYHVLAIMPPDFNFPVDTDLFRRASPGDYQSREIRTSSAIAKLKSGVTLHHAQAQLDSISRRMEEIYPDKSKGLRFIASPLREYWIGNARIYFILLFGSVLFVLLIACTNVIHLLLTRAIVREKEMAIRIALGASSYHISGQLILEGVLLAVIAGIIAVILSYWSQNVFEVLIGADLPSWMEVRFDTRVFGFTFFISVITGIFAGLFPALQALKANISDKLKDTTKGGSTSLFKRRIRSGLVISQIGVALALLIVAGLMMQSYIHFQNKNLGFDSKNVFTLQIDPPWSKYNMVEHTAQFYLRVMQEIQTLPGVSSVALNDALPFSSQEAQKSVNKQMISLEGQPESAAEKNPYVNLQVVSPSYFNTMKIPLKQGRFFESQDKINKPIVAVISERFAASFWKDADPIGKRIHLGMLGANFNPLFAQGIKSAGENWLTVVGISGNIKQDHFSGNESIDVYVSCFQFFSPETFVLIQSNKDPKLLLESVKRAIWKVDPELGIYDVASFNARIEKNYWQQRLSGILFAIFSMLALTMAVVGVYGVMSEAMAQRTKEMGIRLALGAQNSDVLKMILIEGFKLTTLGIFSGVIGAIILSRILSGLLYGVSSTDTATFAFLSLVMAVISLIACFVPARRAMKADPVAVLRSE